MNSPDASLGPFFEVHHHPNDAIATPPWQPMTELVSTPAVLEDRIHYARAALGRAGGRPTDAVALRVAASVVHLGFCARLVSPALAVAAQTGELAYSRLQQLWWQPAPSGAFPMSIPPPVGVDQREALVEELLAEVTAVFQERFAVPARVLWGNVASAINGAAAMLANARPDLRGAALAAASKLLARPVLAQEDGLPGPGFRRRSCCLIYQAGTGGRAAICGDCVLAG